MANDGGPAYPIVLRRELSDGSYEICECTGGMSVRDAFALQLAQGNMSHVYGSLDHERTRQRTRDIYDFAQMMTDEKLRRDKADFDKGKAG